MSKESSPLRLNIARALAHHVSHPYAMRRSDLHAALLSAVGDTPRDEALTEADILSGEPGELYVIGGIAVIELCGVMLKGAPDWYVRHGIACDTDNLREQFTEARERADVRGILLAVHSPGGSVFGMDQLSDAIYAASEAKPTHAYIEDLGCSGAYYAASQCRTISCNRSAMVGSIGVYTMTEDITRCLVDMGIDVRVTASAPLKHGETNGSLISDALLTDERRLVDAHNELFKTAVQRGRAMSSSAVEAIATGQVWLGQESLELGLVDFIENSDAAIVRAVHSVTLTPGQVKADSGAEPKQEELAVKLFGKRKASSESADATPAAEATPLPESGSVQCNIMPAEAVAAGAMWTVDDEVTFHESGAIVELAPGEYVVKCTPVEGFETPEDAPVNIAAGQTAVIEVEYSTTAAPAEPAPAPAPEPAPAPAEPAPAAHAFPASDISALAKTIGADAALKAFESGLTREAALTAHIAELKAANADQQALLEKSGALGGPAIEMNDESAKPAGMPQADTPVARAAAAITAKRNKKR